MQISTLGQQKSEERTKLAFKFSFFDRKYLLAKITNHFA